MVGVSAALHMQRRRRDVVLIAELEGIRDWKINAAPIDGETNARDFDFSKAAIASRWQAGYADASRMIERRPWETPIDPMVGVAVYASDAST